MGKRNLACMKSAVGTFVSIPHDSIWWTEALIHKYQSGFEDKILVTTSYTALLGTTEHNFPLK